MADSGLVSPGIVLAGGAVAIGYLIYRDVSSDPQAQYADEELLPDLREDIEREVDHPDDISDGEAENHIQKWESVARSYYPLLEDEHKDSVPVPPSEFASRVESETNNRQQAALMWKAYAQGILQAYLVQEGRPGFDRDDFVGLLWEILKIALLVGSAISLGYISQLLLRWFRNQPDEPGGDKESARAELGQSIENWFQVYDPETAPEELSRTMAAMADVEINIREWAPETDPGANAESADMSSVLDAMPDFIRNPIERVISLPSDGIAYLNEGASELLADLTDKPVSYWDGLTPTERLVVFVALVVAAAAILNPEPVSTATGFAILGGVALLHGATIDHNGVIRRSDEIRDTVSFPE